MAWEIPGAPVNASVSAAASDDAARLFMARVYRWMVAGLTVTAAVAWYVASRPELLAGVISLRMPIIIGQLVLVLAFQFLASRVSGPVAAAMFLLYSFSVGLTFSFLFIIYNLG